MEVRRLGPNPAQEARELRLRAQRDDIGPEGRELLIVEGLVQGPVTNRVNRHRRPAAAALGHWVVVFDASTEWARAEPAGGWHFVGHLQDVRAARGRFRPNIEVLAGLSQTAIKRGGRVVPV